MLTIILNLFIYIYIIYFICIRYIYIYKQTYSFTHSFFLSRSRSLSLSRAPTRAYSFSPFYVLPFVLPSSFLSKSIFLTPNNNNMIINLTNGDLHFYLQYTYRLSFIFHPVSLSSIISPFSRLLADLIFSPFLLLN